MKPSIPFLVVALMIFNIISAQKVDNEKMLKLVNAARQQGGASPLTLNSALCGVATDHSNYMSSISTLTHDDEAGDMGTRFTKHGYSYSTGGENVAEGYDNEEAVMQG
ncbi:25249_t:CDS:2, partial [Dentiscutata erythropus]